MGNRVEKLALILCADELDVLLKAKHKLELALERISG